MLEIDRPPSPSRLTGARHRARTSTRRLTTVAAQHLRTQPLLAAAIVGVIGGVIGVVYLGALRILTDLLGPEHHGAVATSAILIGVGVFVAIGGRWLGPAGDVELVVDNIHVQTDPPGIRHARTMVVLSLACVAAGGGLGPEAPLVSTNGTMGGVLARRLRMSPTQVRVLTITGMAAGFAVLFGAPLGGALFALEILHRRGLQYHEALIPAVVGAIAGLAIGSFTLSLGLEPIWSFDAAGALAPTDLLWALGAGIVGAGGAWLFRLLSSGLCAAARASAADVSDACAAAAAR